MDGSAGAHDWSLAPLRLNLHTHVMLRRASLFALIVLTHNACGSNCLDLECDDLVNVVFSSAQSGDYVVVFDGQELGCVTGQPQNALLAACGPNGFLLKSGALSLDVLVNGDGWGGSSQAVLEPVEVIDAERPDCTIPCFRAETLMMIESDEPSP